MGHHAVAAVVPMQSAHAQPINQHELRGVRHLSTFFYPEVRAPQRMKGNRLNMLPR